MTFGLVVQGISVWKLRRALQWSRLWTFLVGGPLRVPVGVAILGWASPNHVRAGVRILLVIYSVHGIARPAIKPSAVHQLMRASVF